MASRKKSSLNVWFNPDISEIEIVKIGLEYLKKKKFIKGTMLALVVIKDISTEPLGHVASVRFDNGFMQKCGKVIRKMYNAGVIEKYNTSTYKRTELVYTIEPTTIILTPLTKEGGKKPTGKRENVFDTIRKLKY